MKVVPCPLCGYDALGTSRALDPAPAAERPLECPHCRLDPGEPSLRGSRPGALEGLGVGLAALPRGLYHLAITPGVKRWLAPPFALTLIAFAALFWWLWTLVGRLIEALRASGGQELELDPGWLRRALEWLLGLKVFVWLAHAGSLLVFLLVSAVAAFWTFSIVYEALAGPFLDEIHGRIEKRWFGVNPRDALNRPTALPASTCARYSVLAGGFSLLALAGFLLLDGWSAWIVLLFGVPLPYALLSLARPEYGRWLAWVIRIEGGTLWVSVKAALLAGLVLLVFFPLKFVPGVGYLLFGGVAGFTTALSLLDIPFSRRQWSLRQRLAFLLRHVLAIVPFGLVASLLFVIPFVGPALMVPAASVGGLWMLCRLDKDFLRPSGQRRGRGAGPPAERTPAPGGPRALELAPTRGDPGQTHSG